MSDPAYVIEQYEAIRQEAVATSHDLRGHGLAVFLNRGLPAWLAALQTLAPSPCSESRPSLGPSPPGPQLLALARTELTAVLAGMVLTCARKSEV